MMFVFAKKICVRFMFRITNASAHHFSKFWYWYLVCGGLVSGLYSVGPHVPSSVRSVCPAWHTCTLKQKRGKGGDFQWAFGDRLGGLTDGSPAAGPGAEPLVEVWRQSPQKLNTLSKG